MRRVVLLALLAAGCGKELNPMFCRAHPEDERCTDAPLVDAGTTADAPPSCPATYALTVTGQTSRYRVVDSADDWQSAAQACASDGATTHLVVISSAAEVTALESVMDRVRFIGHSDRITDGTYRAVTDEPGVYPELVSGVSPPWAAGEPNDSGDCVVMSTDLAMLNRDCSSDQQAYLCECDAYADDPGNY